MELTTTGQERKSKLDDIVLEIELLLISVVQGLALTTLAESAVGPLQNLDFALWPYIVTAFLFILVYWAQAILHTLTFIKWPLNLRHSLLYYVTAIVEFLAFAHITNPLLWFLYTSIFMLVVAVLYIFDLRLLKQMKSRLTTTPEGLTLFTHALKEHNFELKLFVPGGILFNILAFALIYLYPRQFIDGNYHLILIGLQGFFTLMVLWRALQQFRERSTMIATFEETST